VNKIEYVILTPEYTDKSAGIYALHVLCDALRKRGYEAFMATSSLDVQCKDLDCPNISIQEAFIKTFKGNAIAVYPEITPGNPLRAKHVARWVLNRPGLLGGDKEYSGSEMVFLYDNVFAPDVSNKVIGRLQPPTYRRDIFFDKGLKRDRTCFYGGKGVIDLSKIPDPDSVMITREWPLDRNALAELFRKSTFFYSFDSFSGILYEAALCGCTPIIMGDKEWDFDEIKTKTRLKDYGIASSDKDIDRVIKTRPLINEALDDMEKSFEKEVDEFIEITQRSKR